MLADRGPESGSGRAGRECRQGACRRLSDYRTAWGHSRLRYIDTSPEPRRLTAIGYTGIMTRDKVNSELKSLALHQGPEQYIAQDELTARLREGRSNWWTPEQQYWIWNPLDITRAPNAIEVEWALIQLSQLYNGDAEGQVTDYVLIARQDQRLEEIEKRLDQVVDSLEVKFFNQLQARIRQNRN